MPGLKVMYEVRCHHGCRYTVMTNNDRPLKCAKCGHMLGTTRLCARCGTDIEDAKYFDVFGDDQNQYMVCEACKKGDHHA